MDAQSLQNIVSLIILLIGLVSIYFNYHNKNSGLGGDGWRELFEQSQRSRDNEERNCEAEKTELRIENAALRATVDLLRDEIRRLHGDLPLVNVNNQIQPQSDSSVNVSGNANLNARDVVGGNIGKRDDFIKRGN